MAEFSGTTVEVPFVEVIDGDTIRVDLGPPFGQQSIRILCLDTEEKPGSSGTKPKTPWGAEATKRAEIFFDGALKVTLEFPGTESAEVCLRKYRGNYDRVLAFVYLDGIDFQETMIREGYSPYFNKYGHADFEANHRRYRQAEQQAQRGHLGVWNQEAVNGQERRNYALLSTWWSLRAAVIDDYRAHLRAGKPILNTRLDYALIQKKAQEGKTTTLFTEVAGLSLINNGSIGFADIGSRAQPFTLFMPGLNSPEGAELLNLLRERYIGGGDDHPRRGYLYATGQLGMFDDKPQMKVVSPLQIVDDFDHRSEPGVPDAGPALEIAALLPDPAGQDAGHETVTLRNTGAEARRLDGWKLVDRAGNQMGLEDVVVPADGAQEVVVRNRLSLNNTGDDVKLVDGDGNTISQVSYTKDQVVSGQPLFF